MGIDRPAFRRAALAAAAVCLAASGCGEGTPKTVTVSGVVTRGGEPLPEVRVSFLPVRAEGESGRRTAVGVTDETGRYALRYGGEVAETVGTVPGESVVTLRDLRPSNDRENPPASRLPEKYERGGTSPLRVVVTDAADQTFDFEVPAP